MRVLPFLDRLSVGVIVCDPDAKVVQINQAAATICTAKDGVSVDRSGFCGQQMPIEIRFDRRVCQRRCPSGLTLDRRDEVTGPCGDCLPHE